MKQKDSEYKNPSLVGKIDCKITNEKSKVLVKCFANSFRKNPQISASNVPKVTEMSLFKTKKKVKKKDSNHKKSSPVGQIARKNRKKKIKLRLK